MKFQVKELAKIQESSIEVKDLTVFVGKNSTNKSYMAHIVYMLNKVLSKFAINGFNYYPSQFFNEYKKTNFAKNAIQSIETLKTFETKSERKIQTGIDEFIFENIRLVTYEISSIDLDIIIENIENFIFDKIVQIVNLSFNANRTILKSMIFSSYKSNIKKLFEENKITIESEERRSDNIALLHQIFNSIIKEFHAQKITPKVFYFPASRTGFILAFDEIVSGVLRDRFGGQPTATKLTEPTIDFISGFSDIKSGKFKDKELFHSIDEKNHSNFQMTILFDFIENRIIKGEIIEDMTNHNYTHFYLQTESREKLDLHLSSSATVELLPLVIFLKHFSTLKDKLLIIEEPEAHLHPKAQVEMARLLVMLVNSGAKVLITTHSDYILNELSNCIKLSSVSDGKRMEYLKAKDLPEEIVIDKERVSAYLFKDLGDTTEVIDLTIDKYGIANDNFDDILDELLDRTEEINELIGL